ncbi:MAG: hypothetical protein C0392_11600 [Syntrophus sp. (in: bacteria)]|nr:hypothetical protein [Syntrophus sp. (in: bacteria)]
MRTLLSYVLVIPLSFIASRVAGFVIGVPISFALIWASVQLRSTIAGFIIGVVYSAAAVAFGWFIFSWVVGKGSFTILPFLSSVLILILIVPRNLRKAKTDAQLIEEFDEKYSSRIAKEMLGNVWSLFFGEISGFILAAVWFFCAW